MKRLLITTFILFFYNTCYTQDFVKENKYAGDTLFDFIHNWWQTKYRYGGESKKGIDCSAFTSKLFETVYKKKLPRTAREQYYISKRIKKDELIDGDLVFFRTKYKSTWHVGVYLTDGWFIHSKSKVGVTFNNLKEPVYSRIYYGAGRIIN